MPTTRLWQNETFYRITQDRFRRASVRLHRSRSLSARLLEAERRNLGHYGFGIKGFMLSMIETAIEVTDGRVSASVIAEILAAGQEMLAHPIELLPEAEETVRALRKATRWS
jgi:putative hydrolase of the HAD superfamily